MKEGDPVSVRIQVTPNTVSPESIPALPQGEIIPVNNYTFDRMNSFRNIIKNVFQSEKDERENSGKAIFFGPIDKATGKVQNPYMRLDSRFRATLNETADRMFNGNPKLGVPGFTPEEKEIAKDLVSELKAEYDEGPPAMSAGELQVLFDRGGLEVDPENPTGEEDRGTGFDYEGSEGGNE